MMAERAELAKLLQQSGLTVAPEALPRLLGYLDELLRWNERINLTSITDRHEALEKHLCDALTLLPLLRGNERLLDLGSGAGLPGLLLSIVLPELTVVSVDSVTKKLMFQRHVARLLELQHFSVRHIRAEELANEPATFDVVTARAFTSLSAFVRLASPALCSGGRLIAMKGPEGEGELAAAQPLFARLLLCHRETRRIQLPKSRAERILIVLQKG